MTPAAPLASRVAPTSIRVLLAAWRAENQNWIAATDAALPRPQWWEAVEDLIDQSSANPSIVEPHYSRGLIDLIDAYLDFLPKVQTGLLPERPTSRIMRALGELEIADTKGPEVRRRTEPIEELRKLDPPIQHDQVAKMYGVTQQQAAMLLAGKWSLPAGHTTPEERDRANAELAQAKALKEAFKRWSERADAVAPGADWKAPPESIEELLALPGMTVEQVAVMHRVPVEQVQAIQAGKAFVPPVNTAGQAVGSLELSTSDLEDEVIKMHKEAPDLKASEIAEMVGNGMTPQRVGKILAAVAKGE